MYEKSLANLDKSSGLWNKYLLNKMNGLVKKPQSFYLAQTFTSELVKSIKILKSLFLPS
jgi:hypothetical protein